MKFGHHSIQPIYRYSCASCGNMLKETEILIDRSVFYSLNERCAVCDNVLKEHSVVIEEKKKTQLQQQQSPMFLSQLAASLLLPRIETASEIRPSKLMFDIPPIDSSLDFVDNGALCIIGKGRNGGYYANTLITRLCVLSFLPKKGWNGGGLDSPAVIFIDAGNCSDIYQTCNFARQYGLDNKSVLDRIIVSRPFTIHQLTGLIVHELDQLLQHTQAKLVVISDIFRMFSEDQQQIDKDEAHWLIKEMAMELHKVSKKAFLVISFNEYANKYQKIMMSRIFDVNNNIIITAESESSNNHLQISVHNQQRRHHRHHLDQTNCKFTISEKDLLLIQPPR